MLPGEEGPVPAHAADGGSLDLFDLTDRLMAEYHRVYLVDLDGIELDRPQLDYLQEIVRGGDAWVDAGVRTADQAIDVLVAGAQRAVLSSAFLTSDRELRRAWRLSSDLVFEVEVRAGVVSSSIPVWSGQAPMPFAAAVRGVGPQDIIVSYRESAPDWSVVGEVAQGGPTWIGGSTESTDATRLASSGAAGALFHLNEYLASYTPGAAE
jgi:hypothetical protein